MIVQDRRKRKASGGRYGSHPAKRVAQTGREAALTKVGKTKMKPVRTKGGGEKLRLLMVNTANVMDPKTRKYVSAEIKSVVESGANRHFIRRNIMTKGTVIETSKGKARITSRPGQDGVINAILV